jgi:hypothetical protein
MTKNPILDELHAVREELLADAGGTLDALVDRLQAEERVSVRPRFRPGQSDQCAGVTKSGEAAVENQLSPPGDR